MEPSHPDVSDRRTGPAQLLTLGAAAAAVVLALGSSGDTVLLAGLLAATGAGPLGLFAGLAVAAAFLLRWGTTSLSAIAGAQAVLGPAIVTGSLLGAVAVALAVVGLLLVPSARLLDRPSTFAVAVVAAAFAAGPGLSSPARALTFLLAVAAATGAAEGLRRWLSAPRAGQIAVASSLVAVAAAALS